MTSHHLHPTKIDRLAVFTFLWACQSLVHLEFFPTWVRHGDPMGWLLLLATLFALFRPTAIAALVALAACSSLYNILKWPFVVNHILVETIVNLAILGAIATTVADRQCRESRHRDAVLHRFRPVVLVLFVLMYYFAFIAKLNVDFLNPEFSCAVRLYGDLVDRLPFLPTGPWASSSAIWLTLLIELLIPVALTFQKTRPYGIALAVLFHAMLGFIGHRTFSALAMALHGLFVINGLTRMARRGAVWLHRRQNIISPKVLSISWVVTVECGIAFLISVYAIGKYRTSMGPLRPAQLATLVWYGYSFAGTLLLLTAAYMQSRSQDKSMGTRFDWSPGWIWLLVPILILNGCSQYLGLKTQTCFTMYSNLRTEGEWNNHLFMPALRLADFQSDLVEICETNHPALRQFVESDQLITHFEFKRAVVEFPHDFYVRYKRGKQIKTLEKNNGAVSDSEYASNHPLLLRKLLYFRPVDKGAHMKCHH